MFEVGLTAPQVELSNGTIAMFWYSDIEISATNKIQARKKAVKMFDSLDYDLMDEDGEPLTTQEKQEALEYAFIEPEIDYVKRI
jgi:hypothetical protein